MRAITIQQPWASLIMAGIKDVENRSWSTPHRGPLAIHAGKLIDQVGMREHGDRFHDYPLGVVLGAVELVDVRRDSSSPWAIKGCWHWMVDRPKPATNLVTARGRLRLWDYQP